MNYPTRVHTKILYNLGNIQKDLVPPSHFAGPHRVVQVQGTTPSMPWANSVPSGDVSAPGPWSAIGQAQQEILELRKDNRRIMLLHKDSLTGNIPLDPPPGFQTRYGKIYVLCEKI